MGKTTDLTGETLIKSSEGCKLTAYPDSNGIQTYGWGSIYRLDGSRVQSGDTITAEQAEELFKKDLSQHDAELNSLLKPVIDKLTEGQFDALSSFAYNEGSGRLQGSTLYRMILADPNDINIPNQLMLWIHAGKAVLDGLIIRRGKEIALWKNRPLSEVRQKWELLDESLKRQGL
ncbi:MAG TPA: lysozyme [Ferruginibacter sp.]|jgi:lysozyme|nr:lysozyme [Ferruginibacter sp.]